MITIEGMQRRAMPMSVATAVKRHTLAAKQNKTILDEWQSPAEQTRMDKKKWD